VIAAGILVELRRAAEFPHHHEQRVGERAARAHIFDERRDAAIELGQLLVEVLEDLRVVVQPP